MPLFAVKPRKKEPALTQTPYSPLAANTPLMLQRLLAYVPGLLQSLERVRLPGSTQPLQGGDGQAYHLHTGKPYPCIDDMTAF